MELVRSSLITGDCFPLGDALALAVPVTHGHIELYVPYRVVSGIELCLQQQRQRQRDMRLAGYEAGRRAIYLMWCVGMARK